MYLFKKNKKGSVLDQPFVLDLSVQYLLNIMTKQFFQNIINLNKGVNNLNDHPKMETFNISKLTFTRVINTANYIDIYNQACTLKERP